MKAKYTTCFMHMINMFTTFKPVINYDIQIFATVYHTYTGTIY